MMHNWSLQDMPPQAGKLAVVTGATRGLGYEAALALALAGAEVVLAGRNHEKGRVAVEKIVRALPAAKVRFEMLDLASLASVRTFAVAMVAQGRPLDLLVNNAGVAGPPTRRTTADGFELQFGTNHLSHFTLTGLLLLLLRSAPSPRVVNVSSAAHRGGKIDFDNLQSERRYRPFDTDFNTIGDDGQVAVMAAQLYAEGTIDLLGFSIPSGNQWRDQEVSDCLKAVERLGIEHRVKVYVGAQYPLLHDFYSYQLELTLFGPRKAYVGAYREAQSGPGDLVPPPPDGFATHTAPAKEDAVHFLIETFHHYPHEVTLLAIGPLTNVALAMREDPTIVPLIKQIVIMGGQIYAPGNAYNDAGEFNWWFDPEAAQVVLRAQVPRLIIPLDVTNTVTLPQAVYDRIVSRTPPTIITQLYKQGVRPGQFIYDTIAFASFHNPSLDVDTRDLYVDIGTTFDQNYGKSSVSTSNPYPSINLLSASKVVLRINNSQFFALYTDLFTRAVPVQFIEGRQQDED
jgi:inosine-uridine nucleoside N-ribohydrolase